MNKIKFDRYNDGIVFVYREKPKKTSFAAKENVSVLDDLSFIVKLDFEEVSKREQDLEFASQNDFSLTMKIKTRAHFAVDNKCKAIINNFLYDVSYVDKTQKNMWLYLTGVRAIDSK